MGGKGGGGGSSGVPVPPPSQNYPAYKAGVIGENMWDMTAPTRSSLLDIYTKFLSPDNRFNVSNLPGYAANYQLAREGVEGGYNTARDNLLSTIPRGGALYGQLGALENNRAKTLSNTQAQLTGQYAQDMFNKANTLGFTTAPAVALQGLGINAADTRSGMNSQLAAYMQSQQIAAQQQAAGQSGKGSLGAGLGSLLGMAMAPMTGGTSLLGTGLSALDGMGAGKGAAEGITSGLGGYSMGMASPFWRQ